MYHETEEVQKLLADNVDINQQDAVRKKHNLLAILYIIYTM